MLKEIEVKSILNKSKNCDDGFLGILYIEYYASFLIACIYCYAFGNNYGCD